jgi:hypothetical protein
VFYAFILALLGLVFATPLMLPRSSLPRHRILGLGVIVLGALAGFLLDRWVTEYCYETNQPCEGEVINWAPWVLLLSFLAAVVLTVVVIVSNVWREIRGRKD